MGMIGAQLGGLAGSAIGQKYGGSSGAAAGKLIGSGLGTLFPYFKTGGRVKKTGPAIVHKGEYVLPVGVKPTKAQKAAVAKKSKK